tara:strand:- start:365 stop:649 length:285 start_codon:yes stop_codon:yes gene_type:complete
MNEHKRFKLNSELKGCISGNKGFRIVLDNGYKVSIQFDDHHYSTDTTVETALIAPNDEFVPYGNRSLDANCNDVQRDMTVNEVIDLLNYARELL